MRIRALAAAGTTAGLLLATAPAALAAPSSDTPTVYNVAGTVQCADADVMLAAANFPPGRTGTNFVIRDKGNGLVTSGRIRLSGGSGSIDLPPLGAEYIGARMVVKFNAGRTVYAANSFRVVACGS